MIICCKVNRLWKRAFCTQCVQVHIYLTHWRFTNSWEQQSTSVPCSVSLTSDLHSFKHQSKCSVNPPWGGLALCECLTPPRGTFAFLLRLEKHRTIKHLYGHVMFTDKCHYGWLLLNVKTWEYFTQQKQKLSIRAFNKPVMVTSTIPITVIGYNELRQTSVRSKDGDVWSSSLSGNITSQQGASWTAQSSKVGKPQTVEVWTLNIWHISAWRHSEQLRSSSYHSGSGSCSLWRLRL